MGLTTIQLLRKFAFLALASALFVQCGGGLSSVDTGYIAVTVGDDTADIIQFRTPQLRRSQTQIVKVRNVGKADLTLKKIELTDDISPHIDFEGQAPPQTPMALKPQEYLQITIELLPMDLNLQCPEDTPVGEPNYCGKLIIESDDIDDPRIEIPINVTRSSGKIQVDKGLIEFENRQPGDPQTESFVITNIGNDQLEIRDIQSNLPSDFELECTLPYSIPYYLPVGEVVEYLLTYNPTVAGTKEGQITIVSSDPEAPNKAILVKTGSTLAAKAEVTPESLSFINEPSGTTKQVTIRNSGGGAALMATVNLDPRPNSDYSITGEFGGEPNDLSDQVTIPRSQTLTVDVTYSPVDEGSNTDLVIITNDQENTTIRVPMRGADSAMAILEVSPVSLNWDLAPGESESQELTLQNSGDVDLQISNVRIETISPTDEFSISPDPFSITIAPGGTEALTVTYARNADDVGDDAANLIIVSDSFGTPETIITLTSTNSN